MSSAAIEKDSEGCYKISGELNMHTVPEIWRKANALLQSTTQALCFDLAGIQRSDSAGLALLIEWMRAARRMDVPVTFRNLPPQLLQIAQVSGLETILPVGDH